MGSNGQKLCYAVLLLCVVTALLTAVNKRNVLGWLPSPHPSATAVHVQMPQEHVHQTDLSKRVQAEEQSSQPLVSFVNRSVFDKWQPNPEGLSLQSSAPLLTSPEEQRKAGVRVYEVMIEQPAKYTCRRPRIGQTGGDDWTYCTDPSFAINPPCLVYSFGINYNYEFDDALGKIGCLVYSFDPSMTTPDHRRSEHVVFYQIGIGDNDNDTFVPRLNSYVKSKTHWKIRTLKTLLAGLKHSERTIDVLKMDIEGTEWAVVRNLLDTGVLRRVKQLLEEWCILPNKPSIDNLHRQR